MRRERRLICPARGVNDGVVDLRGRQPRPNPRPTHYEKIGSSCTRCSPGTSAHVARFTVPSAHRLVDLSSGHEPGHDRDRHDGWPSGAAAGVPSHSAKRQRQRGFYRSRAGPKARSWRGAGRAPVEARLREHEEPLQARGSHVADRRPPRPRSSTEMAAPRQPSGSMGRSHPLSKSDLTVVVHPVSLSEQHGDHGL